MMTFKSLPRNFNLNHYILNTNFFMTVKHLPIASLDGKFTNSSGRKTVIQALRDDFDPLEISELNWAHQSLIHFQLQP